MRQCRRTVYGQWCDSHMGMDEILYLFSFEAFFLFVSTVGLPRLQLQRVRVESSANHLAVRLTWFEGEIMKNEMLHSPFSEKEGWSEGKSWSCSFFPPKTCLCRSVLETFFF